MWESKREYKIGDAMGVVVQTNKSNVFYIRDKKKFFHFVDQVHAMSIKENEDKEAKIGRPGLFPGVAVTHRSITLPDALWDKLKEPYSTAIAELIYKRGTK